MKSLQGQFLVASPHLPDSNFFRTVVLMIQHNEEGAFGVILNRPGRKTVAEIWALVGEGECRSEAPVFLGGPVEGPLLAIHTHAPCAQSSVFDGLFIATRKDYLNRIVRSKRPFRVFCGYAGWGPGQLESEIEAGGWMSYPAVLDDVFRSPDEMWKTVMGKIGMEILAPTIDKRRVPTEPWLN
jgi:putative transcriptional regulator